jgi:hypothetical protein
MSSLVHCTSPSCTVLGTQGAQFASLSFYAADLAQNKVQARPSQSRRESSNTQTASQAHHAHEVINTQSCKKIKHFGNALRQRGRAIALHSYAELTSMEGMFRLARGVWEAVGRLMAALSSAERSAAGEAGSDASTEAAAVLRTYLPEREVESTLDLLMVRLLSGMHAHC